MITPELKTRYLNLRRRFPTLLPALAVMIAREGVKTAARIAATPKRNRARVATLRSQMRAEAGSRR